MGSLDQSRLLLLHDVAVAAGLHRQREVLLGSLPSTFVGILPPQDNPVAQLLSDLQQLNEAVPLADGTVPLASWLGTAVHLARQLNRHEPFERALADLASARPPMGFHGVELLSEVRSRAESRVRMIHAQVADGEIDADASLRLRILYEDARARVNAGIDRLLVEVETTGSASPADPYREVAERAALRVEAFVKAADAELLGEHRGLKSVGTALRASVARAFARVRETVEGRDRADAVLIRTLVSLRWAPFDNVGATDR